MQRIKSNLLASKASIIAWIVVICVSAPALAQTADGDINRPVTIEEIKAAWQAQVDAAPAFEIVLAEEVYVSQDILNASARSFERRGRNFYPLPNKRDERTRLIVQGGRVFHEHEMLTVGDPGYSKNTSFYDGERLQSLREYTPRNGASERRHVAQSRRADPPGILRFLSLKPVFLAMRGTLPTYSGIDFEVWQVVAQDASTVTIRQGRDQRRDPEIVLDRGKGLMPLVYRVRDGANRSSIEITISFEEANGPPYILKSWSDVGNLGRGPSRGSRRVKYFSLQPSIDLANYTLTYPEGTFVVED